MDIAEVNQIILKSFREKKNSHAFLLCTNNVDMCLKDVLSIIKEYSCAKGGCGDCNICHTIDELTNPDLRVVKPDGKEIKKDQIIDIIDSFSTKPAILNGSYYIICNAELLNTSSANKMLKFLEEPEGNIVGFFITDKLNGIIPTIKSRCEIYNYHYGKDSILDFLEITEEEYGSNFNDALKLTQSLNSPLKYELMAESKNIAKKERVELDLLFKLIRKFYVIKYENIQFSLYNNLDFIQPILDSIVTNDISIIVKRIKLLDNIINDLNIYVNKELIINKFFVLWE